ncbi:hypothetical protein, partial [Solemya pervernicosa gill symbiont]|uniref:hypothetical protein n=1 Tax=Solemya pervernicosa gill symbiont TaxID=642797 RepID=UPI001F383D8C
MVDSSRTTLFASQKTHALADERLFQHDTGESLFLRKLVLGIQAQANSKNFTRPFMPAAPRP